MIEIPWISKPKNAQVFFPGLLCNRSNLTCEEQRFENNLPVEFVDFLSISNKYKISQSISARESNTTEVNM